VHLVPAGHFVNEPSTLSLLLSVTLGETQSELLPVEPQADHVEVRLNPQPLDCVIPLLHRLPDTDMLSMNCPDPAAAQALATG
jgi:hypothetical protein